jgi:hypothetical protein
MACLFSSIQQGLRQELTIVVGSEMSRFYCKLHFILLLAETCPRRYNLHMKYFIPSIFILFWKIGKFLALATSKIKRHLAPKVLSG